MAKYTLSVGTNPSGRRRGVVYAAQGNILTVRRLAIPTQPLAASAATATRSLASLAALWLTLSSADQETWDIGGFPGENNYTNFILINQTPYLWGFPPFTTLPAFLVGGSIVGIFPTVATGTSVVNFAIILSGSYPITTGVWVLLYLSPAYYTKGLTETVAVDPDTGFPTLYDNSSSFTASAWTKVFCMGGTGTYNFDLTAEWVAFFGQAPKQTDNCLVWAGQLTAAGGPFEWLSGPYLVSYGTLEPA
jgi:hypothetical protein